jgi:hypothetical protein
MMVVIVMMVVGWMIVLWNEGRIIREESAKWNKWDTIKVR